MFCLKNMKITKYEIDMLNVKSADAFFIHFYDDYNGKDVNKRTIRMVESITLMKTGIILAYSAKDFVFLNYRKGLIAYYKTVDYTEYLTIS